MADNGIAAARKRVAQQTTEKTLGSECQNCVKQGLAILPVVSGILPNGLLAQAMLINFGSPSVPQGGELASLSKALSAKDLTDHGPVQDFV
ncbi:hypothetical protein [Luteimonas lutimaris]|uniref:Uncharacterized protein n=1 Tax=Luteimonas lutimaris TaxID=698645 RepID=A0ABP7MNZ5_9GAMM